MANFSRLSENEVIVRDKSNSINISLDPVVARKCNEYKFSPKEI